MDSRADLVLKEMIEMLDLPDSAYEKAKTRYEDLGNWFDRENSLIGQYKPHIFPQGSFRLGTAIRPLDEKEEYDLDLACNLREGLSSRNITQQQLKFLLGKELESYRKFRHIENELEEKHRCWRLEYKDELSFHMDIVPCIPANETKKTALLESMRRIDSENIVAELSSKEAVNITDDRHENYSSICQDWKISNQEGYAKWFQYRMDPRQTKVILERAQIDNIPLYRKKAPLQRVIQLLKRHRDNWAKSNPDSKPISIIITTLAAKAYNGETELSEALLKVLSKMDRFVNETIPRIPNPVDPNEDFADRWYRPECLHLQLEGNFFNWIRQAKIDFKKIIDGRDVELITESLEDRFCLKIGEDKLREILGDDYEKREYHVAKKIEIAPENVAKPWLR